MPQDFSHNQKGQSLIELIVALGILVIIVSGITFLILNTYTLNREADERTRAVFIAEEGLEAVRSIRDNDWGDLPSDGDYCIALSGGNWIFDPNPPPCSQIDKFNRTITIQDLSQNKKRVSSQVTWDFEEGKTRDVSLVSFFTNWQAPVPSPPTVDLKANGFDGPLTIIEGTELLLDWTTANSPDSCTATGDWLTTGSKDSAGGSESQGIPLAGSYTYTIECSNAQGTGTDSVDVSVERIFITSASSDDGGTFANSGNALDDPDAVYASGFWPNQDSHSWSGYSDLGNTGIITKIELLITGHIDTLLDNDEMELTLSGVSHIVTAATLNDFVGSVNDGDIVVDVTADRAWTFADINAAILLIALKKIAASDQVTYFLDASGLRVRYQP